MIDKLGKSNSDREEKKKKTSNISINKRSTSNMKKARDCFNCPECSIESPIKEYP